MSLDTDKIREKAERLHWTLLEPGRLLLETLKEIDRLRGENKILAELFCYKCGKPLGSKIMLTPSDRYGVLPCSCVEQRTKEACKKTGRTWFNEFWENWLPDDLVNSATGVSCKDEESLQLEQAIDSVGKK